MSTERMFVRVWGGSVKILGNSVHKNIFISLLIVLTFNNKYMYLITK